MNFFTGLSASSIQKKPNTSLFGNVMSATASTCTSILTCSELIQELLRKGIKGLQPADTEYKPSGTSLPGSIEIAVGGGVGLTVPGG